MPTMQIINYTQYGSPDVLELKTIDIPQPESNQVLVKIHVAATNPLDWHLMRADPFLARLEAGLFVPKNPKLGADFSGTVEAIGRDITEFNVGDAVFGNAEGVGLGAFAEYIAIAEDMIVHKPNNVDFQQAAAIPEVGFTALQGLRDAGNIQHGQKVLINGASGGVGSTAVQIAKAYNCDVTGVCSTRNLELVQSIGADHVIDYTKDDFTNSEQQYDLIYDAVGNRTSSDLMRALRPNGRAVIAGFTSIGNLFNNIVIGGLRSQFNDKHVGIMETAQANKSDLLVLKDYLESGEIKPVIDRTYPLAKTAEAIRYLESMRARGKVLITMP